ncbi:MAG TPA: NAD(+)/NADH kinase [Longimicrobiaceae bacterium]|nr:NAD(+)/NADH kinase [Longimicrobiaceae bacterium]
MISGQPPRRIGIVGHARYATLDATLERVGRAATAAGLELFYEADLVPLVGGGTPYPPDLTESLDLVITLGGDGTLLRGARLVAPFGIPILGINLGRLGFLTAIGPAELESALDAVMQGEVLFDERMVLQVEAERPGGPKHGEYLAVNDVVLHRGGVARMIRLMVHAHGEEVGTYSADGIILATPTGSTAYSLSAGGPIVPPWLDCIIATPICPHTLAVRPLILSSSETVTVEVLSPSEELILTIDGQQGARLLPGDRLVVRRAKVPLRLVRFPGQTFFSTLRRKLGWGDLEERERVAETE